MHTRKINRRHFIALGGGLAASLFAAAGRLGAHYAGGDAAAVQALETYGLELGIAFQIADDCLDLVGSAEELGKQPGQDLAADKLTYPAVLGLERSLGEARRLCDEAAALAPRICSGHEQGSRLDWNIDLLQDTARFVASRTA